VSYLRRDVVCAVEVAADGEPEVLAAHRGLHERDPVGPRGAQLGRRQAHVAERGRQADADDPPARGQLQTVQQRAELGSAFGTEEGVQFVDDDVTQLGEQASTVVPRSTNIASSDSGVVSRIPDGALSSLILRSAATSPCQRCTAMSVPSHRSVSRPY
jgi:hypothetical protein